MEESSWDPQSWDPPYLYRDVAHQSNARYLNALACVEDPTPGLLGLDTLQPQSPAARRPVKAFNLEDTAPVRVFGLGLEAAAPAAAPDSRRVQVDQRHCRGAQLD
jgi:hypothetical protein